MKKFSIEKRVDLLLKEGVDKPEKWMPLRAYEEPGMEHKIYIEDFWGHEWRRLLLHHEQETGALLDIIGELVKRVNSK